MTGPAAAGPHVVAIGGGHGLAMLLKAVRTYAGRVTAIVATGDDGGSSGRLREDIHMPAPGDLRRCLTSVSPHHELAEALEHRFQEGDLAGHAVGNLVLAGLVDAGHDLAGAAAHLSRWLGLDPAEMQVLPATEVPVDLVAETVDGTVRGQVEIEGAGRLVHIGIDPADPPVPVAATEALAAADQIVLGPGSFYTSVLAPAVVPRIRDCIAERRGRFVY
ncbi:MAG TPA: uridine diphosphate-N-acetylglucosamine-binding protein YvcK, partial [Acidimicrobiales bacterium]|nr:uridine diphosphate-N-acetylglucosamine-binding protein YvcK [Acidimicrobiales bacterium]